MPSTPFRSLRAAALLALLAASAASGAGLCDQQPVLTPLATDTRDDTALFSLTTAAGEIDHWLVVIDARKGGARLFADPLADLRTGASHGPGSFLGAGRCGDDCFQPLRWTAKGWQPLGYPIEHDGSATLHFTYDRGGSPWLVFHQLTATKGFLAAQAYRWDGTRWTDRGSLLVQAVGSPGAGPDARTTRSIVSGTGRFSADAEPAYWLPALPALDGSSGGRVVPLAGRTAAYLTFDSRVLLTVDGSDWRQERWTPWESPLGRDDVWQPGLDYSIDRPTGTFEDALPLVWYDDRLPDSPRVHLTRWRLLDGWQRAATLAPVTPSGGAIEHVLLSADGRWLLLGPCRSSGASSWLDALAVDPDSPTARPVRIPLAAGWLG